MLLSTANINYFVILLSRNHIFVLGCGFMKSIVCFMIVWLMTVIGHGYTGMSGINRKILIWSVFFLKFDAIISTQIFDVIALCVEQISNSKVI